MNNNLTEKDFSPISGVAGSTDYELSYKKYDNNYNMDLLQEIFKNLTNKNNFQSIINNENFMRNTTFNSNNKIPKPFPLLITNNLNMNFKLNMNNILPLYFNSQMQEEIKKEKKKKKYFCNCKKTKCLKLYCECFANGEYCIDCNCNHCLNIIGNENEITKNYNEVKDKNPVALKFNLTSKNNDISFGCNCTKSNCLKKYCECFKLKKKCGDFCRCRDCDNLLISTKIKKLNLKRNIKNLYEDYVFQKINVLIDKNDINVEIIDNIKNLNSNDNKIIIKLINNQQIIEIPKSLIDKNTLFNLKKLTNNKKITNDITLFENFYIPDKNINIYNGIYEINSNYDLFIKHINNKKKEEKNTFNNKEIINELTNKKRNNPISILGNIFN